MNKWKVSFFAVLTLLIVANVFWIHTVLNASATYSYQQVTLYEKSKTVDLLGSLIVKNGQQYSKKDILYILRQANKDAFIVEEENQIIIDNVKFIFENGVLSEVKG